MGTENPDFLSMPDEEFGNLLGPAPVEQEEEETEEKQDVETPDTEAKDEGEDTNTESDTDDETGEDDSPDSDEEDQVPTGSESVDPEKEEESEEEEIPVEDSKDSGKEEPDLGKKKEKKKEKEPDKTTESDSTDYKSMYEKIMAPFNANGKTIQLNTPEEAIQLMQMGANYTRKMQSIAPHRKVLLMLENNKLLDEDKLSYLIDIDKKNPDAIKKLVKDAGIDPMDLSTDDESETTYQAGNHRVSDAEATFRGVLEDVSSTPDGKKTLQLINSDWDQASKEVLWEQPEVMQLIHQQRGNGIYDRISTEVERQKALGSIPPHVPFLQAYKKIGEDMANAGVFNDLVPAPVQQEQQQERETPTPAAPVARRVSTPKPSAANGDKASAASPTRSTPRKATTVVNPLSLDDAEFEKQFAAWQGRV